jgi:aromatase
VSHPRIHHVEHSTEIDAPSKVVFELLADIEQWPLLFTPTVHVTILNHSESDERLRLWATANGEVRTWTSMREVDRAAQRITFRQDQPTPPLASMGGQWRLEPLSGGRTRVVLTHDYSAVDDDARVLGWLSTAVDTNSTSELAALRDTAAMGSRRDELGCTFSDTVRIRGSAEDVYRFLYEAAEWPRRLPHVVRLDLREDTSGVQLIQMDTRSPDGDVHTTRSVRVCFPTERIVYKQVQMPKLLAAHTGVWQLDATADGVDVTSNHTVVVEQATIPEVLGADASVADAQAFIRAALGANSKATLEHARAYAEGGGDA